MISRFQRIKRVFTTISNIQKHTIVTLLKKNLKKTPITNFSVLQFLIKAKNK